MGSQKDLLAPSIPKEDVMRINFEKEVKNTSLIYDRTPFEVCQILEWLDDQECEQGRKLSDSEQAWYQIANSRESYEWMAKIGGWDIETGKLINS